MRRLGFWWNSWRLPSLPLSSSKEFIGSESLHFLIQSPNPLLFFYPLPYSVWLLRKYRENNRKNEVLFHTIVVNNYFGFQECLYVSLCSLPPNPKATWIIERFKLLRILLFVNFLSVLSVTKWWMISCDVFPIFENGGRKQVHLKEGDIWMLWSIRLDILSLESTFTLLSLDYSHLSKRFLLSLVSSIYQITRLFNDD